MITNLKLLQVQTFMAKVSLLKSDKNCRIKSLPSRQRFDSYVAGYILAKVWQSCKKFGRQVAKVRSVIERIDHISEIPVPLVQYFKWVNWQFSLFV